MITTIFIAVYTPTIGERLVPPKPSLQFDPIREDENGRLLVIIENLGAGHSVVKRIDFCPPGEWLAVNLTDQDRRPLYSWDPQSRLELFTIEWANGDWRIFCNKGKETLRVLEGARGIAPKSSGELLLDSPKNWLLKTNVDHSGFTAKGECALTLYGTGFFGSKVVSCDPKFGSE